MRIFDSLSSPWFRHDQEMIVCDLLDEKTLAKAISGCEVVYNFAAIADLNEALNKPIETAKINVLGNGFSFQHQIVDLNRRKSRRVAEVLRGRECEVTINQAI